MLDSASQDSPPPGHGPRADEALDRLLGLMRGRRTVVLAGAGCSTESGIPDYRGPEGRLRTRSPVQFGEFVRSDDARRRYWARSTIGWRRMSEARPNGAHHGLAQLEEVGVVVGVITQNVDGLHQAAGSRNVVELHGTLGHVVCLVCGVRTTRAEMQERLVEANRAWLEGAGTVVAAPDGDAELAAAAHESFVVPACAVCEGVLKPDVVFFGETVPRDRVDTAWGMLAAADVLLVVGSSLTVYSGRRFVYGAQERGVPVGVINLGPTRADDAAAAKVEGRLGEVVPRIARELTRS